MPTLHKLFQITEKEGIVPNSSYKKEIIRIIYKKEKVQTNLSIDLFFMIVKIFNLILANWMHKMDHLLQQRFISSMQR